MDKKLEVIQSNFQDLHVKKLKEYEFSHNEALLKEIEKFNSLREKATETLAKLEALNKRSIAEGRDVLQTEAIAIFKSYKKLKKASEEIDDKDIAPGSWVDKVGEKSKSSKKTTRDREL
jgi:hypothetical protein